MSSKEFISNVCCCFLLCHHNTRVPLEPATCNWICRGRSYNPLCPSCLNHEITSDKLFEYRYCMIILTLLIWPTTKNSIWIKTNRWWIHPLDIWRCVISLKSHLFFPRRSYTYICKLMHRDRWTPIKSNHHCVHHVSSDTGRIHMVFGTFVITTCNYDDI